MNDPFKLLNGLRKVSFFAGLDEETLVALGEAMSRDEIPAGTYLCREGEKGDRLFILESGELVVEKQNAFGESVRIASLVPGDAAGASSMFAGRRRSASLRAVTDCLVWTLDHETFKILSEAHSSLARALIISLSSQLGRGGAFAAELLSSDLDRRFRIAFFDSKPYMRTIFEEQNRERFAVSFLEPRLTLETAMLARGARAVCVFVNDTLDAKVVEELHGMGVELIALRCAGYNNVDLKACERFGVSVVRVPSYSPHAVAEHAVALILTLNRKVHRAHNRVREANFSLDGLVGFDIFGKTLGVVGAGKIGRCLIDILLGFGCDILVYDAYVDATLAALPRLRYVTLEELFERSDIISLHAPLLPETRHMIDESAIAKMKTGVMLINTSRGALIDTQALLEGLKSGKVGYAGLDVYEEESGYFFEDFSDKVLTDDVLARLTTFNNVIVTSHQAFLTKEALSNIAETTLSNIETYFTSGPGETPVNLVTR